MVEVNIGRNVGTQAYPESWLHLRTVALLHDALTKARSHLALPDESTVYDSKGRIVDSSNEVRVRLTPDGELSGNLMDGVKEVIIPGEWDSVGGVVPDLICKNDQAEPVRIIEVIVTNPPDEGKRRKLDTLMKRGVDVVEVEVKTEQDLLNLRWVPSKFKFAECDVEASVKAVTNRKGFHRKYGVNSHNAEERVRQAHALRSGGRPGWRSSRGYGAPGVETANEVITKLIHALLNCSPGHRRQFLEVCKELGSLDSLLPMHPLNPLREELEADLGETE